MLFAPRSGGMSINKSQKGDIRKKSQDIFFFRKTSFVHSRSATYYALFLESFGVKFLPDTHHCVN